ncbi:hypothetical protein V2J09_021489 [Rumex salicifolius]
MGCRFSKKDEAAKNGVVSVCGDRKRLAKAAVQKRKAFADAHCKYIASLSAVSSAIGVFVASFPSSSPPLPEISLLKNSVDSQNHQALAQTSSYSWSDASGSSNNDEEEGEEESRNVCEHFYDDGGSKISSTMKEIGWDFFNLLDNPHPPPPPPPMATVPVKKEKLRTKKREIDKMGAQNSGVEVHCGSEVDSGRELVGALKDLKQHFGIANESGLLVSRMLEVNKPHLQPLMEEFREKSSKLYLTNTCNRSPSSQSSKSLISWTSKTSSTWTDSKTELFVGDGGMESGSHSFTLGRLYAWEKKLYDEVKAAEQTRKCYQQKCSQMKKPQGVKKEDDFSPSKKIAEITYLYNRILVLKRSVESISKQIEKLRDEELQPQLVELLHGLMRTWKIMSETHETQNKIISGVKSFNSQIDEKHCNESHRVATLKLEKELRNWQCSFLDYTSTQKAYVMCLCGWLSKLIDDTGGSSQRSALVKGPTLLIACQNWLASLEKLPEKQVKFSMKSLVTDLHDLWVQQGEENEARKKVDGMVKEMDRKAIGITHKKEEGLILLLKPNLQKFRGINSAEEFIGKKNMIDFLRMRVESEKVKHQSSIERTQAATLDGLKMGFSSVFESLTDFSKASMSLYAHLVTFFENSDGGH